MAQSSDAPEEEPIDVEFTSAEPEAADKAQSGGTGPGWIGLISVGVVAALAGGAIGVVAGGTDGRYAQASEVAVDISKLAEADRGLKADLTKIGDTLRNLELRVNTLTEDTKKSDTEQLTTLTSLGEDLASVKAAYLALLGDVADPLTPDDADTKTPDPDAATDEPDADAKDLPMPTVTLASVLQRLEIMEANGNDPKTALPKDFANTLADLQKRTEDLAKVDVTLNDTLKARETLLKSLTADVEGIEKSVSEAEGKITENSTRLEAAASANTKTHDELTKSLETLRKVLNDRLTKIEGAKLSQDEEALLKRADRILALSTLETTIRSGEAFNEELEKLALLLPANSRIAALRKIADEGAPTVPALKSELEGLKPAVRKAGIPDKPSGQWAWLGELLASVVTVREEGSATGGTASELVDKAVASIQAGDLASAIADLKTVDGEPGKVLEKWIAAAERRVRADSLLERLRNDVVNMEGIE